MVYNVASTSASLRKRGMTLCPFIDERNLNTSRRSSHELLRVGHVSSSVHQLLVVLNSAAASLSAATSAGAASSAPPSGCPLSLRDNLLPPFQTNPNPQSAFGSSASGVSVTSATGSGAAAAAYSLPEFHFLLANLRSILANISDTAHSVVFHA